MEVGRVQYLMGEASRLEVGKSCNSNPKAVYYRTRKYQCCRRKTKAICWRILSCSRRPYFCSIRPSTDWVWPTHITEGNLLYLKPADININLIQKHLHRNIQSNVWPHSWALWQARWHKINCHNTLCVSTHYKYTQQKEEYFFSASLLVSLSHVLNFLWLLWERALSEK